MDYPGSILLDLRIYVTEIDFRLKQSVSQYVWTLIVLIGLLLLDLRRCGWAAYLIIHGLLKAGH